MKFKVVPFMAVIKTSDTSAAVAAQMQSIIDSHSLEGWEYVRMDTVETVVKDGGCFGIGGKSTITSYNVLVFNKAQ